MNAYYERGLEALARIDGPRGAEVIRALRERHPQLATYIVEIPFGRIYAKLRLEPRQTELVVVGIMAALGNARPQLEVHVAAALHVGATPEEIVLSVHQAAIYAGFPAALNALAAVDAVFEREGIDYREPPIDEEPPDTWQTRGRAHLEALRPGQREHLEQAFGEVGRDIPLLIEEAAYGRVLSRQGLDRPTRQMITVGMLAALGVREPLEFHVRASRRIGVSTEQLEDVMYLSLVYAGFPRAIDGMAIVRDTREL